MACNGDGDVNEVCSRITGLQLTEGEQYWVVVGGHNGVDFGDVRLAAEYQIPSPPPPPSRPPPPSAPPRPPAVPGFDFAAASEDDLRSLIVGAAANISIYLPPSVDFKLKHPIECTSNIKVAIASSGEGATLDGQGLTGLFYLEGGCSLTLRGLTLVNGRANFYTNNVRRVELAASSSAARQRGEK